MAEMLIYGKVVSLTTARASATAVYIDDLIDGLILQQPLLKQLESDLSCLDLNRSPGQHSSVALLMLLK